MKSCLFFTMVFLAFCVQAQSDWSKPNMVNNSGKEADIVYRYGDVDNLNQGWPPGFNPFKLKTTYPHRFPFKPTAADPTGTDRIMVASGFKNTSTNTDGYTSASKRPDNNPIPLLLKWPKPARPVQKVILQIFVDDFQPGIFAKNYHVYFDGERIPYLEYVINNLKQSGPVGKLITVDILPQYIQFFEDGELKLFIDDPYTKNGDGFAIDFVQLMVNPKLESKAVVKGKVVNYKNDKPIENALVTASNGTKTYTDKNGQFRLTGVTSGLAVVNGSAKGFKQAYATTDVTETDTSSTIKLELRPEEVTDAGALERILKEKGELSLRTILFDVNSDQIKAISLPQLKELAGMLKKNNSFRIELMGHTDSDGNDTENLTLSQKRAEAVLLWLKQNAVAVDQYLARGYGEAKPIADNNTEEGRELNRRVEIRLIYD